MKHKQALTIGILAHVDAGKTSLTEALLFAAGATQKRGNVDDGSAITDGLALEKKRGISIKTASVQFSWKNVNFNIIDTPGHIDFAAEVDRALFVLDLVILVVSAVEGVQAHTLNLWESIKERQIPVLIFMNKIDRNGADLEQVFMDLEKDLSAKLFALNYGENSQADKPKIIEFENLNDELSSKIIDKSFENLAELDEDFLEQYLEGDIKDLTTIKEQANKQILEQNLVPILFGSAKLDLGIQHLLNTLITINIKNESESENPTAKIFKIEYDHKLGRLAHLRLYSSSLKSKDTIWSQNLEKEIKVNQIFKYNLGKIEQVSLLEKDEIGLITSSEIIVIGDVLGKKKFKTNFTNLSETVLSVQAIAEEEKDYQKLGEALEILNIEDPQLNLKWYKNEREFHLKILGPIQTEVLKDTLKNRFNIATNFLTPQVIYKETPKQTAEGFVRYWMPKPCWAIMKFLVEPAPLGSGVKFTSKVRSNDISIKYQNEVKRAIPWALKQGIKGWEVTDLHITLLEGSEHEMHSNPGDFLLATPMGVLRALEAADTELLEPMYAFQIKAKQELLGAISSDLIKMDAHLETPKFEDNFFLLSGKVPVEKAMNYPIQFNATTSGKGRLKLTLDGYQKTNTSDEKIRAYKGVSPLDEAQWILHNRGAFKADDRLR